MTEPKMVRCGGSGREVDGPDEQDGTVLCRYPNCGRSDLIVKRAIVDGKELCFVPEHKRRLNPFRRKGITKVPRSQRMSRRDSGRRR